MKIATGLELEALKLEEFIKFYKANGLRERIMDFDYTPFISNEDITIILKGDIPEDKKFDKWYVIEAITEWLKTNKVGEHINVCNRK